MNKLNYLAMRDAERNTLIGLKPNVMVTHNFGGFYKAEAQQKLMQWFYCALQDDFYGRNWVQKSHRWPLVYGYREHPNSNPHYHALAKLNTMLTATLICEGSDLWLKRVGRGQLDVKVVKPGKLRPIIYCTKHLTHQQAWDDRFIYSDTRNGKGIAAPG